MNFWAYQTLRTSYFPAIELKNPRPSPPHKGESGESPLQPMDYVRLVSLDIVIQRGICGQKLHK